MTRAVPPDYHDHHHRSGDESEYADNIISYAVENIMDEFGDVDEFEITDHIKDKYGDNLLEIYNNSLDN